MELAIAVGVGILIGVLFKQSPKIDIKIEGWTVDNSTKHRSDNATDNTNDANIDGIEDAIEAVKDSSAETLDKVVDSVNRMNNLFTSVTMSTGKSN